MRRDVGLLAVALSAASLLASCTGRDSFIPVPTTGAPAATPEPLVPTVSASVRIVPARIANLGFVVAAAVSQIPVSEGQAVKQGETLMVLDTPGLSYETDAAASAVTSAQADEFIQSQGRRKWDGFKFVWLAGPPEQRQLAHARVLQAQASLQEAQARLAQGTLTAPFDGTVVAINVSRGELVQPGEVAVVMADLSRLRVQTTDLSERDIASIRRGQRASIHLEAFEQPLLGAVTAIDPRAGTSADGDTVYQVTIELDEQPAHLLWGMTGTADILLIK
jgi:multidrug efflux pump subunit AcrA (membrane-fusion protein)